MKQVEMPLEMIKALVLQYFPTRRGDLDWVDEMTAEAALVFLERHKAGKTERNTRHMMIDIARRISDYRSVSAQSFDEELGEMVDWDFAVEPNLYTEERLGERLAAETAEDEYAALSESEAQQRRLEGLGAVTLFPLENMPWVS